MATWLEDLKAEMLRTDLDVLRREWAEVEAISAIGPNAFHYLNYLGDYYSAFDPPQAAIVEDLDSMAPSFSGSFFFVNIVPWTSPLPQSLHSRGIDSGNFLGHLHRMTIARFPST